MPTTHEMRTVIRSLWSIAARLSTITTLVALLIGGLWAAEPAPFISDADWNQPKTGMISAADQTPTSPGKALGTMALALVAILGVGIGALVLIKRVGVRRTQNTVARHVTVVETLSLGVKRSISVLRIGDQVVLVGNHEMGLTALATLPASVLSPGGAEAVAASLEPAVKAPVVPPGTGAAFAAVLENLVGKSR